MPLYFHVFRVFIMLGYSYSILRIGSCEMNTAGKKIITGKYVIT